jgi:hypothetical protein
MVHPSSIKSATKQQTKLVTMNTTNRILAGIERAKAAIASKGLTAEKIEAMRKSMDMSLDEYSRFQELKSLASTTGRLTLDEAQSVYAFLGNTPQHFNDQPLAVKYTLTSVFQSLLNDQIMAKNRVGAGA